MNNIIENLRQELIKNSDEKTRISGERFFKEDVKLYGIKSAEVSRISKEHYKAITDKSKENILVYVRIYGSRGIWKNHL